MSLTLIEPVFFRAALACYVLASFLYIIRAIFRWEWDDRASFGVLGAGLAAHACDLLMRTYIGHVVLPGLFAAGERELMAYAYRFYAPWSNWHEALSFFSFLAGVVVFVTELRSRAVLIGAFVMPLVVAAAVFALRSPYGIGVPGMPGGGAPQLVPALQSPWKLIHPPAIFAAYALFTVAAGAAAAYLMQELRMKSARSDAPVSGPSLDNLENIIYQCVRAGFVLLTVGVVLGARWAYEAWGGYWRWDPKETASLVTWVAYLVYLHGRAGMGWRGRRAALAALAGFIAVIFTFIGVNYMRTLHGFLSGNGA